MSIILIAAPEHLEVLKAREDFGDAQTFSDREALRALEIITRHRPDVVALERVFAATARGAALINRIKADPKLARCEIRIVAHDTEYVRPAGPRPDAAGTGGVAAGSGVVGGVVGVGVVGVGVGGVAGGVVGVGVGSVIGEGAAPGVGIDGGVMVSAPAPVVLDQRGTRRAPRHKMAEGVEVMVDGNAASLVDLSVVGAQVVSATILKPNQRVRMLLADGTRLIRFSAGVAWAAFELAKSGARYRAGIEFFDAEPEAVERYCETRKK